MASKDMNGEIDHLYQVLLPALSRAAIGDFGAEIEVDQQNSVRVNEILMGVSVLLEVIRDQAREIDETKDKLAEQAKLPGLPLLDEVLGRPDR